MRFFSPAPASRATYSHNAVGQIVTRALSNASYNPSALSPYSDSYVPDGLNQYDSAGGVTPTYDARGNMTGDGTKTYTYDFDNRIVDVSSGAAVLSYDPEGRLYDMTNGGTTHRFLYDGADIIAEYNAAGTLVRRYVHGPGVDEPLVWLEGSGTTDRRHLFADERGSIVLAEASTNILYNYDEYGRPPAAGQVGRFQYTGQVWLAPVGLYHYKARDYHPKLGRFMQTDPIGYAAGSNLYAYVLNDPVNATDPSGLYDERDIVRITGSLIRDGVCTVFPELCPTKEPKPSASYSGGTATYPSGGGAVQCVTVPGTDACLSTYHRYTYTSEICDKSNPCCTVPNVFQSSLKNPAPSLFGGSRNSPITDGDSTLTFVGLVNHTVDANSHIHTNETTYWHVLHPGTIYREVFSLGNKVVIHTVSIGYGPLRSLNEHPTNVSNVWGKMDNIIRSEVVGSCPAR